MSVDRLTRSASPKPKTGIVHLGLGAFFRAFGAPMIATAMEKSGGDWGILGVSLRRPDIWDALQPQNWAYTSVTMTPDGETDTVIEVLTDVLVAPEDPGAVLAAMADPAVKIVSLTVTEKGYCHSPSTGKLNLEHPDIQRDLNGTLPCSAIGFLVRALQSRMNAGVAPFTVMSCDNLPENGPLVRGMVLEMAREIDPKLSDWIAENGRFPATMVDRITPATTQADIDALAARSGKLDLSPVIHESFAQWAIEDSFVNEERPDFAAAGAEMVRNVTAHEHMKLRMLNGTHSALAYMGYLAGYQTISDTVADPSLRAYAETLWGEIAPAVTPPEGASLADYQAALLDRYSNPKIQHRTWQIAMDGSQKLPQRLLGTLEQNISAGRPSRALEMAVAAWMRYVGGIDEAGNEIDVQDPHAAKLRALSDAAQTPSEKVAALLAVEDIFPTDLAAKLLEPLSRASEQLYADGAKKAAADISAG